MIKILLPVITVLFLAACGSGEEKEKGGNSTTAPKPESQAKATPKGGNAGASAEEKSSTKKVPSRRRTSATKPPVPSPSEGEGKDATPKTTELPVQKVDGSKPDGADSNATVVVKANVEPPKATDLIGGWTTTAGEFEYVLQLQKDSVGKMTITKDKVKIEREFKWEVDGSKYTQTGKDEVNEGIDTVDEGTFAIKGDILTLTFEGEEHILERVKVASKVPSNSGRQPVRPGQGTSNRPGQGRPSGGPGGGFGGSRDPFAGIDGIKEEQKKTLNAAREEMSTQMRGLFTDSDTPREERSAKMQEIRETYEATVKKTLTEEQFTKYQESRSRTGQGGRGSGGFGGSSGRGQGGGQGGFGGRRPR